MRKLQKIINVTALATETSHIFCCVLPTVFSLLSLLVGLGVIGAVPSGIAHFHDLIHDWEIPIIITSGVVILFGWAVNAYAKKMDCKSLGAGHEVCEPRKKKTEKILKIATVLFLINISVYFLIHKPTDQHRHDQAAHAEREAGLEAEKGHNDGHHGHDH